ncbi:MAG: DNA-processing protein DprA [Deltaproteobacteria bacterium]|jgi:predicted Rossmann fold nucleotide-binding protein DprA/Smf involved in DNA uptake|nr:DNA-processing protein DprA [Deltaproteobacteria bacterium]
MTRSDDAKAVVALASRLGDSQRPSLSPTRWHRLYSVLTYQGIAPADVFAADFEPGDVPGIDGDLAATMRELLDSAPAATVEASDLDQIGIDVVTIVDDAYPTPLRERLGDQAPPVLFSVGDLGLLDGSGIGIVGSRDISEDGKEAAETIARTAAEHGRPVVSGAARGVDTFAMNAAFLADGVVIGVLADSLHARIRKPDVLRAIDAGRICLVSQQHPKAGFSAGSAMARNKLVYALTSTTVVICSDLDSGGTWAGATEALKKQLADVAIWNGPGAWPGNARLIELGGRAITTPNDVFALAAEQSEEPEQLTLG